MNILDQEVSDRIDRAPISAMQLRVMVLSILMSFLDGFDIASMGIAVPLLAEDWSLPLSAFGGALAAAFIGVAAGGFICGPLGDRLGRKPLVIASGLLISIGTFGTLIATGLPSLIGWRILTGIGFGAAMPNLYALVGEFAPARSRMLSMTCLAASVSAGGMAAGLCAPMLVALGGWQAIFMVGGSLPLTGTILILALLGESPKFLAQHPSRLLRLTKTLRQMHIDPSNLPEPAEKDRSVKTRSPVGELLAPPYLIPTLFFALVWLSNAFIFYLLQNWLPAMLIAADWEKAAAMRSVAWVYAGGLLGGLLLSRAMDVRRGASIQIMIATFCTGVVLFLATSQFSSMVIFQIFLFLLGLTVGGTQYVLPGLGSTLYPTRMLGTAIGWIGATSRLGAILGPLAGGEMLAAQWSPSEMMLALGAPTCLCALLLIGLMIWQRRSHA